MAYKMNIAKILVIARYQSSILDCSGYGMFGNLKESLEMSKQHFAPFLLYNEGAVDDMIRGLSAQASQEVDRFFSNQVS